MALALSEELNPHRNPRTSVNPGETYVNIPKLAEGIILVPNSVALLFNLNVAGHANNTLANNVGRN